MQKDGADYHAENVDYAFGSTESHIEMELSHAYPEEAGIRSFIRKATLYKGNEIVIEDTYDFSDSEKQEVVLSLMTYEKTTISETDTELICSIGDLGTLSLEGGNLIKTETIPITDSRLAICWKHEIYRTLISITESKCRMRIS